MRRLDSRKLACELRCVDESLERYPLFGACVEPESWCGGNRDRDDRARRRCQRRALFRPERRTVSRSAGSDAHELVALHQSVEGMPGRSNQAFPFTTSDYRTLWDRAQTLSGITAHSDPWQAVLGGERPRPVGGLLVSCNYFDVLEEPPILGRRLLPSDCATGTGAVAVLGQAARRQPHRARRDGSGHQGRCARARPRHCDSDQQSGGQHRLLAGTVGNGGPLASASGFLALVLAAVGVYGIVSYFVTSRFREIGIRQAVGATAHDVLRLVLRRTMGPVLAGAAVGLAGAVSASGILSAVLFGVSPADPLGLGGAAVFVILVALAAGVLAVRGGTRGDPIETLRYE